MRLWNTRGHNFLFHFPLLSLPICFTDIIISSFKDTMYCFSRIGIVHVKSHSILYPKSENNSKTTTLGHFADRLFRNACIH